MRGLISATGSYGDIYPFVAVGRELKRRGHDVRFFASSYFSFLVERSGLNAVGIGSKEAYEAVIRHPDAFHARKGIRLIARTNLEYFQRSTAGWTNRQRRGLRDRRRHSERAHR